MRQGLFFFFLLLFSVNDQAQTSPLHCATGACLEAEKAVDPELQSRLDGIEQQIQQYMASHHFQSTASALVTVPVVFHIVYNTTAQNLPDGVIYEQMAILNADYAKLNADTVNIPTVWKSIAANTQLQFALANRDTLGNPTNGIIHTYTALSNFSNSPFDHKINYSSQGGADVWNPNHYLNIWVCNLGSGILGYTQMPGGGPASRDGCVINYIAVGKTGATSPYNLGRTVTHEVGHWFNLIHVWGPGSTTASGSCTGSDQVSDTPPEDGANFSNYAPFTVKNDVCSPAPGPGYMWQNYLNYTDDAGMCMFTQGQAQRMQAALYGPRDSILTSPALGIPVIAYNPGVFCYPSPSTGILNYHAGGFTGKLQITLYTLSGQKAGSWQPDYSGPDGSLDLSILSDGLYLAEFRSGEKSVFRKIVLARE